MFPFQSEAQQQILPSEIEHAQHVVRDAFIVSVLAFVLLQKLDDTDGNRQGNDLIKRLQHHLPQHQLRQFLCRHHATEGQREEDEAVRALAKHCAPDSAQRETLAVGRNLHAAHHVSVDKTATEEGDERSQSDSWCQSEDGMETRIVRPIGSAGDGIAERAHSHEEEVHRESCPYQQAGLAVTPHFTDAVVDNVRDWKNEQSARQTDGTGSNLLGLKHVCRNQANTEEYAEKHEQHTHVLLLFLHFLVFYEVFKHSMSLPAIASLGLDAELGTKLIKKNETDCVFAEK